MAAYLIVRAVVPEVDRATFDQWYQDIHLPEALAAFGAVSACRGWSHDDPAVHFAFYEFPSLAEATAIGDSQVMRNMRADFDRNWQDRISRTRQFVEIAQKIQM
jgi:hypothetical protein